MGVFRRSVDHCVHELKRIMQWKYVPHMVDSSCTQICQLYMSKHSRQRHLVLQLRQGLEMAVAHCVFLSILGAVSTH